MTMRFSQRWFAAAVLTVLSLLSFVPRADAQYSTVGGPGGRSADYDIVIGGDSVLHFDWNGKLITAGSGWSISSASFANPTFTGQVKAADGLATAPSYTFTNNTNDGFYRQGSHDWRAVVNGSSVLEFNATRVTSDLPLYLDTNSIQLGSAGTADVRIYRSAAKTLKIDTDGVGGALTNILIQGPLTVGAGIVSGGNINSAGSGAIFWGGRAVFRSPADGQVTVNNQAETSGVGFDVTTDGTLIVNNRAENALGTVKAGSYSLALSHALPADQTGNATATFKMNGLGAAGAACTITPTSTGRVVFTITGDIAQNTTADGVTYKLVYGTGAAPANAAAASGTVISAVRTWTALTGMLQVPFAVTASVTGLTVATAVWFDLQIADVTGGTASAKNIDCTAHEL